MLVPSFAVALSRLLALPAAAAADLARVDQRDRWEAGDRVPAERYLAALPHVAANPDDALVLVYGEFLLRTELGEAVDASVFEDRFSRYREPLGRLFEVHRGMAVGSESVSVSSPVPDLPPVVSGYDQFRLAGRGGMGAVYQAREVHSGRPVAVKVVRTGAGAGSEELVRFLQETDILSRLRHPNVVRFLGSGITESGPYQVTEWLPCGSLVARLGGPVNHAWVFALARGVARGLEAAHAVGVIHRDVKPGNILLDGSGGTAAIPVPKLTDFGLARLVGCGGTLTATGEVLGTRRYMPPEQVEGRHRDVGPWSDVFSLGAVVYELLTGRAAFPERDTPIGLSAFTPPTPPRELAPNVPALLERVCLTALAYNPTERFRTAAEFLESLDSA